MRPFEFQRSAAVEDAIAELAGEVAPTLLAGGTTLLDLVKLDVMRPQRVIDINRLPLSQIEEMADGGLRIGALVRNSTLAWHDTIKLRYPVLSAAILSGASPQLRNMATTAGNLMQRTRCPYFRDNVSACNKREPGSGCAAMDGYNRSHAILGTSDWCIATHPSDMCVALAALDATVEVQGASGTRHIAFCDFHRLPADTPHLEHDLRADELITAVLLAPPLEGARAHYLKLRDRESFEFALSSAAVLLVIREQRIAEARVALGGIATKPWRSRPAEQRLRDAPATRASFEAAADAALANATTREHNKFKLPLARQAIIRALETAMES